MKAYIDSSVLLRMVLHEPNRLREWTAIKHGVTSVLAEVECLRTLDRLAVRGAILEESLALTRESIFDMLDALEVVDLSKPVLSRASSPFPTPLGTLDAIHLSTALAYRDIRNEQLTFATHDKELAKAARAVGFKIIGV